MRSGRPARIRPGPEPAEVLVQLQQAAAAMSASLDAEALARLQRFVEILLHWRRRVNLVAQRTSAEVIAKHIQDSLAVLRLLRAGWRTADLGSGAGFPGMVLGIARPEVHVVLVESRQRKASFLRSVARELGLANVEVLAERVEESALRAELSGALDLVVSRAVWPLDVFLNLASSFLRPGGIAVAMKGRSSSIPGLEGRGYSLLSRESYELSRGEARSLIIAHRCFT